MAEIHIARKHLTQPQGRVVLDWGSYLLDGARHVVMGGLVAPYQQGFSPMLRIGGVGEGVTSVGVGARGSGLENTSGADRYVVVGSSSVPDHTTVALYVPANISDQSRAIAIRNTTTSGPTSLGTSIRSGFGQNGADLEFYLRRAVRVVAPGVLEPGVPVVPAMRGARYYVNGGEFGAYNNNDNPATEFGYCGGNQGSGNGTLLLCVEYPVIKEEGFVKELSKIFREAPFQLFRADPIRIYSLPSGPISLAINSITASNITSSGARITLGLTR